MQRPTMDNQELTTEWFPFSPGKTTERILRYNNETGRNCLGYHEGPTDPSGNPDKMTYPFVYRTPQHDAPLSRKQVPSVYQL